MEKTESVVFDGKTGLLRFARSTGTLKNQDYRVVARYEIDTRAKTLVQLLSLMVESCKDATLPAKPRGALVQHLTTTSLPVYFRRMLPEGGKFNSLRAALAACSGEAPVSTKCGQCRGLLPTFGGEEIAPALVTARDATLKALGVSMDEFQRVARGEDPWSDEED
jgi:hypothetical protein